ncbi:MAG: DNA-3-methyladenine glycosylase [Actinobacteria bacterium]|nr:DNA-3-methyladenine glycosylase [Actinomycetota bacterium]
MTAAARRLLEGDVVEIAPAVIGWELTVAGVGGRIVEVEAYRDDDPASHSFGGPRGRNRVMFGPAGAVYVYRSYGIHWCLNLVCGPEGRGAALLVRALEPLIGVEEMRVRRGREELRLLCSGPGRLTQALAVTGADDGATVGSAGRFQMRPPTDPVDVRATRRVGITKAVDQPWRFLDASSPFVSRPRFP